ncbi:MAG: T9SS type A sorting domain-containing protein [Flavobacteriia bacterium]|nr:T9SS type A sorting domain-containing protein [Flavobacteriia bacterium]
MKNQLRLLILILCFFLGAIVTSAQQLLAFPEYAYWSEIYKSYDPASTPPETRYYESYEIEPSGFGDSTYLIIDSGNNAGLIKLDSTHVWYKKGQGIGPAFSFFDFEPETWYLLYDFSMEVGDTAYWSDDSGVGGGALTLVTVDSIRIDQLNNVSVKHFYLSNNDEIIEKLGSIQGLFRPYLHHFELSTWVCQYQGYFSNPDPDYIEYLPWPGGCSAGLQGTSDRELSILSYPNPANDVLHVTLPKGEAHYSIITPTGQVVEVGLLTEQSSDLNISHLSEGMYMLQLTGQNGEINSLRFCVSR